MITRAPYAARRLRGKLSNDEAREYVKERLGSKFYDTYRRPQEMEWIKNYAFLAGNQHFVYDRNTGGFREGELAPHVILYRANFYRQMATRMIATVMSSTARIRAPARDWSKQAKDEAFVTEKLVEHLEENVLEWPAKLDQALHDAFCCGSGFFELFWDTEAGEPDRFYLDGNGKPKAGLSSDEMRLLEEKGQYQDIPPGEIGIKSRSPFHMLWDWNARRDFNECMWAGTREIVDIEYLENLFGYDKTKDIAPAEPKTQALWSDEMLKFMAGPSSYQRSFAPMDKNRSRTVLERYFERPHRGNDWKGRFIMVAGDVTLTNGPNHMQRTKYPLPFVKLDWQTKPGSFIGHAPGDDLRNPQFQYNNGRAKQTEILNIHSHPPMFLDKRAGELQNKISIEGAVLYQCDTVAAGGSPIVPAKLPDVPKELTEGTSRALSEMQAISSQADPDMSALPASIRGGPAMDMMIQERNKGVLPTSRNALAAQLKVFRMALSIAKYIGYTTRRKIRYVGEDNAYRVLAFDAAQIQTDLRFAQEPEHFKSKAADQAKMVEYVQAGVLNPALNPDDRIIVLKTLAYGNAEQAIAEKLAQEENQERELDEMAKDPMSFLKRNARGNPMLDAPTNPFDDDEAHMRVMRQRMLSEEWRKLNPYSRQLWMQHYSEHEEKRRKALLAQMQMQQMTQGSPGQKGSPSQPKKGAPQRAA